MDHQALLKTYRDGLLMDVIPFWLKHALDRKHNGVYSALDRDGSLLDTDKSVWVQGRFAWMMGELANHRLLADFPKSRRVRLLAEAESCCRFLENHCFDPADGRMYFHVTEDGRPIRKRRYAYSESFAAIAFGEMHKATGSAKHKRLAEKCFQRFVDHNLDPQDVEPKFTNVRPSQSIGFPMICINTASELRDSIGLESANEWIDRSIEKIRSDFVKPEINCVMETVGSDGQLLDHFDGRTLNPGHAIEGAWFIMAEGKHRNDPSLIKLGCEMLDWMWERGWDTEFGGMLYFVGVDQRPVQEYWHDMKFWWPHNETTIATLMAYQLTGDEKYQTMHSRIHQWTHDHFPDAEHGEWYGYLRRDGSVSSTVKGNLWKSPFHIPRMQLVCWDLLSPAQ